MKEFFKLNPSLPACGGFTLGHLIASSICIILIVVGIIITVKIDINMNKFLLWIGVGALLLEILKISWGISVNRYDSFVGAIPLWFCSLFVPASILAALTRGRVQHLALTFMFYGGIIGGAAYLLFPTTSLYRFPLLHFLSWHSMFYHSLMIYTGIVIGIKKVITPTIKDLPFYCIFTTIMCIIAYIVNVNFDTNYMFLNSTSNNPILKMVLNIFKQFYPVAITIFQNVGSFFVSYGIAKLIKYLFDKKHKAILNG